MQLHQRYNTECSESHQIVTWGTDSKESITMESSTYNLAQYLSVLHTTSICLHRIHKRRPNSHPTFRLEFLIGTATTVSPNFALTDSSHSQPSVKLAVIIQISVDSRSTLKASCLEIENLKEKMVHCQWIVSGYWLNGWMPMAEWLSMLLTPNGMLQGGGTHSISAAERGIDILADYRVDYDPSDGYPVISSFA